MTDQPYTPTETTVRYWYIYARRASAEFNLEQVPDTSEAWAEFDRWLAARDAQVAAQALLDAAESNDLIDHMYSHIGGHGLNSPAAVRATATYLHHRADQMEGDDG